MTRRRWAVLGAVVVVAGALVAIRVPDPGNPPVRLEPQWDSPRTRELAARACFDCHSNETVWPAYAKIPPFSWLVRDHVREGRQTMNFSEWNREYEEAEEAPEMVRELEMPLDSYLWIHPEARLTTAERTELADGLERTIGTPPAPPPAVGVGGADEEEFQHPPPDPDLEAAD